MKTFVRSNRSQEITEEVTVAIEVEEKAAVVTATTGTVVTMEGTMVRGIEGIIMEAGIGALPTTVTTQSAPFMALTVSRNAP